MLAAELIDPMLPTLKLTDTAGAALEWMQEHRIGQLVVTDESDYRGVVSEDLLLDVPDEDRPLADIMRLHEDVAARENQHLYEVLAMVLDRPMDVVAVLNDVNEFIGTISVRELLRQFARELGVQETGAVLIVNVAERDYSLTEISRLIESNNCKIVSSYFATSGFGTPDRSRLTLKLNRRDITAVVATLERYNYQIEAAFANLPVESIDQERLDSLLRYLST